MCHEVFTNVRQNSSDGDFIVIEFCKSTGKMSTQSQGQSEKSRLQTKELKKVYKEEGNRSFLFKNQFNA